VPQDFYQRRAGDALFARAKNDEAWTVAHHAEPISDSAMDSVIDRIQADFSRRQGVASPVAIQKVRGMDDLPPALQMAARRQLFNLGKDVFFESVVYVVQQAHSTPEEVEKTIFRKLCGHAATATLFGREWAAKQNALLDAIGGEGLYRLAAANDLHAYAASSADDASLNDQQRSAIMMDELLARVAEK
jgi:hypothetical protein